MSTKLLTISAASVASLVSLVCYAGPQSSPNPLESTAVVHYADLNLDKQRDVARLYQRIANSADKVCGPRALPGSYMKTADYASCYKHVVTEAVATINAPLLTAYHRERESGMVSMVIEGAP